MAAGNQQNIQSLHFLLKLFLSTRELAYVRINICSNTWNGYTADNQEERLFFKIVSKGLTDRRKTAKNLVDSRKNWKILTVSRKQGKKELIVKEIVS